MDFRFLIVCGSAVLAAPALAAGENGDDTRSLLQALAGLMLAFVLVGQWLARRLMAVYRRKIVERMNSDADAEAARRALHPERLLLAIQRRRRVVLAILCAVVLAYSGLAAQSFYWYGSGESRPYELVSFSVTAFLFLSFSGPVVLLGVSAARFARHFWTYFGPAAFAAVVMQTIVAVANDPNDLVDDVLKPLLLVAGFTLVAVAVRQALPVAVRDAWALRATRRTWLVRIAGLVAAGSAIAVMTEAKDSQPWTVPVIGISIGYETVAGVLLAAVVIWVCYAVMVDRVQRILVPLLALSLALLAFGGLATYLLLAGAQPGQGSPLWWTLPLSVAAALALPWLVLGWIAIAYERKLFSESQFQIWSWMVLVTGAALVTDALLRKSAGIGEPHFVRMPLVTLGALVAYTVLARLLVRPLHTQRRLLVLRVFAQDERQENVLEDLEYGWRFIGPIVLIGAPDFASRTIDPGKAARFLQKLRVSDLFVDNARELERRLVTLDDLPDPDGRYRVNDLFCRNNTWQDAVRMLLASSEAILVDLREYNADRRGTTTELHMLAEHGALARTVLLVGPQTQLDDVARALGMATVEQLRREVQLFDADAAGRDRLVEALVRRMPAQPLPGLRLQIGAVPADAALVGARRAA